MDAHVLVERKDSVLSITLARPERRNAITVAMYSALAGAIESAADNRSIRLITIEGQGEDFTAGNDLGDFLQAMPEPGSGEDIPVWRRFGRWRATRCRSSPRSTAMRSASAPPCCSIVIS